MPYNLIEVSSQVPVPFSRECGLVYFNKPLATVKQSSSILFFGVYLWNLDKLIYLTVLTVFRVGSVVVKKER